MGSWLETMEAMHWLFSITLPLTTASSSAVIPRATGLAPQPQGWQHGEGESPWTSPVPAQVVTQEKSSGGGERGWGGRVRAPVGSAWCHSSQHLLPCLWVWLYFLLFLVLTSSFNMILTLCVLVFCTTRTEADKGDVKVFSETAKII